MIALFLQEILSKLSEFGTMQQAGFNPFQAMLFNVLSSMFSFAGAAAGIAFLNSYQMQYLFSVACGFMLHHAFAIILPQMEECERMMVCNGSNPIWPFAIQNFGLLLGYITCAVLAYEEVEHNLPW